MPVSKKQIRAAFGGPKDGRPSIDPGMVKGSRNFSAGSTTVSSKNFKPGAKVKVRPSKKSAANVGKAKGQLRLVNGVFKERRFTPKQRDAFRTRKAGMQFGGPNSGRPNPR